MGGGVHWAEWIMPVVGAHHMAYNAAANASGSDRAKLATPGSQLDKKREGEQKLAETQRQQQAEQADRQRLADEQLVANLPRNVRSRAEQSAKTLGESGRRQSAAQYLAG